MDDSALEEDLSVAVAAVMDVGEPVGDGSGKGFWALGQFCQASGLVVRVVAKSFFRSLEEAGALGVERGRGFVLGWMTRRYSSCQKTHLFRKTCWKHGAFLMFFST